MIFPVAGDARDFFFQVLEGQHREWRRIPVIWLQNTGVFPGFFFVSVILEMNPAWDFPRVFCDRAQHPELLSAQPGPQSEAQNSAVNNKTQ